MILLDPRAPFVFGVAMIGLLAVYLALFHAMPGPLASPHEEVIIGSGLGTCERCHTGEGLSQGCLTCHQEIVGQIESDQGYHAFPAREGYRDCSTCHPEHLGADFPLVSALSWKGRDPNHFKHDHVSFALMGAHDSLACDACHGAQVAKPFTLPGFPSHPRASTFLGLTQTCVDCHEDVHAGGLASECLSCHDQQKWRPAPRFRHDEYFALEGAHARAECSGCHLIPASDDPNALAKTDDRLAFHRVRGKACTDCHENPHRVRLAEECTTCHFGADSAWADGARGVTPEVHAAAGFVLDAVHVKVACDECHSPDLPYPQRYPDPNLPNYVRQAERCENCHADPHDGQFSPRYASCLDCHEKDHFSPSKYDVTEHAKAFPLVGAHASAECKACHAVDPNTGVQRFTSVPRQCESCHDDPHAGQFQSRYATCLDCHEETRFKPARYDVTRHANAYPLTGTHATVPCIQCHETKGQANVRQFVSTSRLCKSCHQDPHGPQFEADLQKGDCTVCHIGDASTFVIRPYDHQQRTGYSLAGAHAQAQCNDCHREQRVGDPNAPTMIFRVYRGSSAACASCHRDEHRGQFRRQGVTLCDRCHGSTGEWSAERFDHNRDSRFALEGTHVDLACRACHPSVRQPDGQYVTQYRPLGTRCEDCHAFVPKQ